MTRNSFHVEQHDRDVIETAVRAVTDEPVEVGNTFLAFLATLTPATSGGVTFHVYGDGEIESAHSVCGACGRSRTMIPDWAFSDFTWADTYFVLHALAAVPRPNLLLRVLARIGSCRHCSNHAIAIRRTQAAWENRGER